MDHRLSPPGTPAVPCTVDELAGTAKSIGTAAVKAGYDVRAVTSPAGSQAIGGRRGMSTFHAYQHPNHGWTITIGRPGWPLVLSNVVELRKVLAAA